MTDIKKIVLSVLLVILLVNFGFAQSDDKDNIEKYSSGKLLKQAKKSLKLGDIFSAIDYYKIYDEIKPGRADVQHDLGMLLFKEKNYKEAKKYLYNAYEKDNQKYLMDLYYYALSLQAVEEYDNAKYAFELFQKEARRNNELKEYVRMAKVQSDLIDNIPAIKRDSALNVTINLLDTVVNKPHIEFSPVPYDGDKLIYASLNENKLNYYDINKDKLPVRKFYVAKRDGRSWKSLGEFDTIINGNNINTGNGAFSADKNRFYFSRCEKEPDLEKILCKILVSRLENNEWQQPVELPSVINTNNTNNSMPAIGVSRVNSDVLYFVSDRLDGRGGADIWFSYYDPKKEEWKEPKNCGKKINTVLDEITPYYNIDTKTLYFSSDGHPTFGGFDIYKAVGEGRDFSAPVNVGYPINSSYDDLYYILEDSRERGFFTSNRPGGYSLRHETCCDDIYEFVYRDFINIAVTGKVFGITDSTFFKSIEQQYKNEMALGLDILDHSNDIELMFNYPVNLYMVDAQTGKENFIKISETDSHSGRYFFNLEPEMDYVITVRDFNEKEKRLAFTTRNITHSDTLELDAILVSTFPAQSIIVQNIYYEFTKAELTKDAKNTIDITIYQIMKTFPDIIVEISSHTDSIGSDQLNDKLSQARAQSVVDYLISKGINKDRLVAKGYGRHYPIATNTNPDGSDNPEGRQKNRRTEFRIIGQLENIDEIIYGE
ncbi:MAG: OmpA family protein [Bacteroidales bacterium]|nr:OmpA family protein [Bacteroidales bacterium]